MYTPAKTQPALIINVSRQGDGYIFDLRPRSRVWLETNFPDRVRVSYLLIGLDKSAALRQLPETVISQVLNLITGLSIDEMMAVGGYALHNTKTGEDIMNPALLDSSSFLEA